TLDHFDPEFALPFYATDEAAGADIKASLPGKKSLIVKPGSRVLVPTGLCMEIPPGYEIQVRPRSGLSLKSSLLVVNSPGTIDSDYRGEVNIIIGNFGTDDYEIEHGLRIAQLVIAPVLQAKYILADAINDTARGAGGFGSTGTK
ncbi:MAG TPA: dUTP diphosphatase, partial [Bacteriovoracaceae bacterium]|nr:dUTP diphosphatase [Bacteriovoracaceae bacterium]